MVRHLPLRRAHLRGPNVDMYRRFAVGDLLTANVLDTRQYRSPQACGGGWRADCTEALQPNRTMLGATQERWQADFQVLDKVSTRDGRLTLRKSFVVEYGRPGLVDA